METFANTTEDFSRDPAALPLRPTAFGTCARLPEMPSGGNAHLLLAVRSGGALAHLPDGTAQSLAVGSLLYVRAGAVLRFEDVSGETVCEFVRFDADADFMRHLDLPDALIGEAGEGASLAGIVRMNPYALEFAHDCLKIGATVYFALAKLARDRMLSRFERFDALTDRLSPAMLQIEQRYAEPLTVRVLAYSCRMSESQFSRLFKQMYGCTPIQYLIRVRLDKAKSMLADGEYDLDAVAAACGLGNAKYFGELLKKHDHITPRELRVMYKETTQLRFF